LCSLLQQIATSSSDMEGLILGNITSYKVKTVHDSNTIAESESNKFILGIQGFKITGDTCSFYDPQGNLSQSVKQYLERADQLPIGWFRYRKNSVLRPSIRELAVHSNISTQISAIYRNKGILSDAPCLFGLFTFSCPKFREVQSYDYRFFNVDSVSVSSLDIEITNLVNSSQSEYSNFIPVSPLSDFQYQPSSNNTTSNIKDAELMYTGMLDKLKQAADQTFKSTSTLRALEDEVKKLHKQLDNQ